MGTCMGVDRMLGTHALETLVWDQSAVTRGEHPNVQCAGAAPPLRSPVTWRMLPFSPCVQLHRQCGYVATSAALLYLFQRDGILQRLDNQMQPKQQASFRHTQQCVHELQVSDCTVRDSRCSTHCRRPRHALPYHTRELLFVLLLYALPCMVIPHRIPVQALLLSF